jgi:predicted transposase/invertase (TIGR01784 family)
MGKFKPSKEEVQSLMHYLTQEGNALDSKKFIHNLIENTPRYREDLMTIAEYLKQEGRQEGRQEGGRKREKEIARNLLSIGLEHNVILQATGMSRAELDDLMDSAVKENR